MNDLIGRQEAIDAINAFPEGNWSKKRYIRTINELPLAKPERKKGGWIKKMRVTETEFFTSYDNLEWCCSCCGAMYDPCFAQKVNFCYLCGADMRGEKSDDKKAD